jgi:hypothetical protein
MSRTLPLGNPSDAMTDAPTATAAPLAGVVAIYDPAMCCATGVCGPAVDPALLALTRDLRWFEKQGVTVQRYGLSQEPQAFVQQSKITGLMHAFGDKALPGRAERADKRSRRVPGRRRRRMLRARVGLLLT